MKSFKEKTVSKLTPKGDTWYRNDILIKNTIDTTLNEIEKEIDKLPKDMHKINKYLIKQRLKEMK